MPIMPDPKPLSRKLTFFFIILAGVIMGAWLYFTPPGLLGKADAIGYAVCHRISERSFQLGNRAVPLCARCSGMYLGAFVGLALQLRTGKKGAYPPRKFYPVIALFVLAFGIDGLNSYLHFFPNAPTLYEPQNWSRLLTGTLMGINIALITYPTFNQSIWRDFKDSPPVNRWRDLAIITLAALVVSSLVYTEISWILYPLAVISSLTVLLVLALVYTVLWSLILKRENTFTSWRSAIPVLASGFTSALLQIALFDLVRFLFTGTWAGFFTT